MNVGLSAAEDEAKVFTCGRESPCPVSPGGITLCILNQDSVGSNLFFGDDSAPGKEHG